MAPAAVKPMPAYVPKPAVFQPWPKPKFANFAAPVKLNTPHILELMQMHTFKRPGGSGTEKKFNNVFLRPLGAYRDDGGNYIVRIGDPATNRVLWSSHTDTVHRTEGKQRLSVGEDGILALHDEEKKECLGADCTVGVWIMRQMILRRIPGLYIFHAFEETGGLGSRHIATKTPDLLKGIDYAIAFDRKGINSVITHQMGRCASDEFGLALAKSLNVPATPSAPPGEFVLDTGGTFTDTANYVNFVPECTNISVGYWGQHGPTECLDLNFADHLLNRICALDVNSLPVKRDPTVVDYDDYSGYGGYGGYVFGGRHGRASTTTATSGGKYVWNGDNWKSKTRHREEEDETLMDLVFLCKQYPAEVARFLYENGFTADDVEDFEVEKTIEETASNYVQEDAEASKTEILDLTDQIKSLEDGGLDLVQNEEAEEYEEDPETGLHRALRHDD